MTVLNWVRIGRRLGLVVAATFASLSVAGDWPVFRGGPLQTGVSYGPLPNPLVVRWSFKAQDAFEGSAALVGGVAYVGSMDEYVYAFELGTGRKLWSEKVGPIKVGTAVRKDSVYVGNLDGVFYSLEVGTGRQRWKFQAEAEITSAANFAGDNVLFGSGDEHLYCLGPDGKLRWKFKVAGGPVLATPAIVGDRTFVSGCDSTLHILNVDNGKEIASVALEGQTGSSIAVAGNLLYVGTMTNEVLAIDWQKAEVVWRFQAKHPKPFFASAAVNDSLVFEGSRDKNVYGLDRTSGKEVWSFATDDHVESSPIVADGHVYTASLDGKLYVLTEKDGKLVQQLPLGKAISASPAASNGWLVIGNREGVLYGLSARAAP
jgi:outer membrane protein assembly factor BamB